MIKIPPPKKVELSAVFIMSKATLVKHWRRSDQITTLCSVSFLKSFPSSGIARECPSCLRLKRSFEAQQSAQLAAWQKWHAEDKSTS